MSKPANQMTSSEKSKDVEAVLRYTINDGQPQNVYVADYNASTIKFESKNLIIKNGRRSAEQWSTETNGFQLVEMRCAMEDGTDLALVNEIFLPAGTKLLKELTGAQKVILFHTASRNLRKAPSEGNYAAASNVHIDYNQASYEHQIRQYLGDEADIWLKRRWAAYNIWKPFETVEMNPLAVCDSRTVEEKDLILCGMGTTPEEPLWPVKGINVMFNENHKWYYFPYMTADEALVIKLCDSDHSKPQWTAHSAFSDPTSPLNAAPRVSMEGRFIAFF